MEKLMRMAQEFLNRHKFIKKWRKVLAVMMSVVVFMTTYAMILPAITLETGETDGIGLFAEPPAEENEPAEGSTVTDSIPDANAGAPAAGAETVTAEPTAPAEPAEPVPAETPESAEPAPAETPEPAEPVPAETPEPAADPAPAITPVVTEAPAPDLAQAVTETPTNAEPSAPAKEASAPAAPAEPAAEEPEPVYLDDEELIFENETLRITLTVPLKAMVPADAELSVREIGEKFPEDGLDEKGREEEYLAYAAAAGEGLHFTEEEIAYLEEHLANELSADAPWARFFALSLENADGEILPADKIPVEIVYKNTFKAAFDGLKVVSLDEEGKFALAGSKNTITEAEKKIVTIPDTEEDDYDVAIEFTDEGYLTFGTCAVKIEKIDEAILAEKAETEESAPAEEESVPAEEESAPADESVPAEDESVPADESDSEKADETPVTLEAKGADYTVTMTYTSEAKIPDGAVLTAEEIMPDDPAYEVYINDAAAALDVPEGQTARVRARFFDIKIMDGENEVTPAAPVRVDISYEKPQERAAAESVSAVHFPEEGKEPEVVEIAEVSTDASTREVDGVSFEAGSFSVYGVVYTVDFEWEVDGKTYEFSLPGGGYMSLRALIEALHVVEAGELEAFMADVANVEFSNSELVWVGKTDSDSTVGRLKEINELECKYSSNLAEEQLAEINAQTVEAGDWALISLQPFTSEEKLTISMIDGAVFEIKVTDATKIEDSDKGTIDTNKSYLICYQDGNDYYVLKNDGSVEKITTNNPENTFEGLNSSFAWTFNYIFTEKDIEHSLNYNYYLIRPIDNKAKTIALNEATSPANPLVQQGNNNTAVLEVDGGFVLQGYHNIAQEGEDARFIQLSFVNGAFKGIDGEGITVQIYEMDSLPTYGYKVRSADEVRGSVSVENGVEHTVPGENGAAATHYIEASSNSDKKNAGTITATPVTLLDSHGHNKWKFDHWEQDNVRLDTTEYPAVIDAEELPIPFNGSNLVAYFVQNPDYEVPDAEKQSSSFEDLSDWLAQMKDSSEIPLDEGNCKKTAEVYDYENRIYRVDLTAKSNLELFEGLVKLGFIIDVSGSMKFPSDLKKLPDKSDIKLYQINDSWGNKNWLTRGETYYFIADEKATATVYRLWYADHSTRLLRTSGGGQDGYSTSTVNVGGVNYYYKDVNNVWLAVDASHSTSEVDFGKYIREIGHSGNTLTYRFTNSKPAYGQQADNYNTGYQIYRDNDAPNRRLDYLESSIDSSTTEMRNILNALTIASDPSKDQDIQIAWNTFCAEVKDKHHNFSSVKTTIIAPDYTTSGGTRTDLALDDAYSFNWTTGDVGYNYSNYAILITDGAPQYSNDGVHNSGDPVPYSDVEAKANRLKAGKDGILNTADDVKLITVGLSMQNVDVGRILLHDLADTIDGERMFFNAESSDELDDIIYNILKMLVKQSTVQGTAVDTVGEAFYPVDKNTGMALDDGDKIDLEGNKIIGEPSGAYGTVVKEGNEYKIKWEGQDITWDGWHGTVYVKAKEDLLGGNAVKTNEAASVQATGFMFHGTDEPISLKESFKELVSLPSPRININELGFPNQHVEITVPLGTTVDPKTQLKEFYENILVEEVVNEDGSLHYDLSEDDIADDREGADEHGKNATFELAPVILDRIIVEGSSAQKARYLKTESGQQVLNWENFFEDIMKNGGVSVPYHPYGIEGEDSNIVITLTKVIKEGEIVPEDISAHPTTLIGAEVEKYTLTVRYNPDYTHVLPAGQGGNSTEDFHTGTYGSMYQGHAAGRETSKNVHVINVFEGDGGQVEFDKTGDGNQPLEGAVFTLYTDEACHNPVVLDGVTVTGTSDASGRVTLTAGARTISFNDASITVSGIPYGSYYMKETSAPVGYQANDQVYFVHIRTEELGGTSFIAPLEAHLELEDDQTLLDYYATKTISTVENEPLPPIDIAVIKQWSDGDASHASDTITFTLYQRATTADNRVLSDAAYTGSYTNTITGGGQVMIPGLPVSGIVNGQPVLYSYYVEETSGKAGYVPQISHENTGGTETWTILNIAPDSTDLTTAVHLEKLWKDAGGNDISAEHEDDEITVKLIQTAYESGYEPEVQVTIRLVDADQSTVHTETKYVKAGQVTFTATRDVAGTGINEHWVEVSVDGVQIGSDNKISNTFSVQLRKNSVITATLSYKYVVPGCGGRTSYDRWLNGNTNGNEGVHWQYSLTGSASSPVDAVNAILNDENAEVISTQEYTYTFSKDSLTGGVFTNIAPDSENWTGTITGLPLFKKIDDSTYYVYSYAVDEIAINGIPVENGETAEYTVEVENGEYDAGDNLTAATITNTMKSGMEITIRKVAEGDVGDSSAETLPGAVFTLEKYADSSYRDKVQEWTEQTVEDSDNETPGVFAFTDLSEGYYQLVETTSPEGYVKTAANPRFCIKPDGIYAIDGEGQEVKQTDMLYVYDDTDTIDVGNARGAALPNTGGTGTHGFNAMGLALVLGAVLISILRKRFGECIL